MIGNLMIVGAAVIALTAGAPTTTSSPPGPATKDSPKHAEKRYVDHEGNKLTVHVDDQGKVVDHEARDSGGTKLNSVQLSIKDFSVCSPRPDGAQLCQALTFLSEGAFFKMGTHSCTCCNVGGFPICYGNTCK